MGPWDGFVDQNTEIQSIAPANAMSVKWEATAERCELPSPLAKELSTGWAQTCTLLVLYWVITSPGQHRNFIYCLWNVTFGLHQNHRQLVGNLWLCIFDLKTLGTFWTYYFSFLLIPGVILCKNGLRASGLQKRVWKCFPEGRVLFGRGEAKGMT